MLHVLQRLRRASTVIVAAAAITATVGIPTASADDACGANHASSAPTVYHRACWKTTVNDGDTQYQAEAKIRIPSQPNPTGWTACELRIAIFVKVPNGSSYNRARTVKTDCVGLFQALSTNGTVAAYVTDGFAFVPQPGYCYEVLTHWLGTYSGNAMDSDVAVSGVKCGANRPGGLNTDIGSGVVDTTELAPTIAILPTLDGD